MLSARLEKLLFIVQEMELAGALTSHLRSDEVARNMGRRILVRAGDLIASGRAAKQDIVRVGGNYRDLKGRLDALEETFNECAKQARDRLGAHLQPIDFLQRIEVWHGIDKPTLDYFVDAGKEIYLSCLGAMSLPGYVEYTSFPEVHDNVVAGILAAIETPYAGRVVMATDVLAAARPNTAMPINLTPVHQRAGELVAIDRWMLQSRELYRALQKFVNLRRVLTAHIVTDVVSFADCLITRDDTGARPVVDALDKLVPSQHADVFTDFKRSFKYADVIGALRVVRNQIGAHVDGDPTQSLERILAHLDGLMIDDVLSTHARLRAVFHEACRRVVFLSMYRIGETPLRNVLGATSFADHKPFDPDVGRVPDAVRSLPPEADNSERIDSAIQTWCAGGIAAEGAREALGNACASGPVVERIETTTGRFIDYRLVHVCLETCLRTADAVRVTSILQLVSALSGGYPDQLMVLLRRTLETRGSADAQLTVGFLFALGELPVSEPDELRKFLWRYTETRSPDIVRAAFVADLGIASLASMREDTKRSPDGSSVVAGLLRRADQVLPTERVAIALALGGRLVGGHTWFDQEQFTLEFNAFCDWATLTIKERFPELDDDAVLDLVRIGDFSTLTVVIATKANLRDVQRSLFYALVASGWVPVARDRDVAAQGMLNRALACVRLERVASAAELLNHVWNGVDTNVSVLVACIEILTEAGINAQAQLKHVRSHYVLTHQLEQRLLAVDDVIACRAAALSRNG